MISRRPRKTSLLLVLSCVFAISVVQFLSSGSARVTKTPASPAQHSVEAEGFCMLAPVSLEERTERSGLIVEGRVIASYSFWDSGRQNIYTSNAVEVFKVFKGTVSPAMVEVITQGGTVGNQSQRVDPSLQLGNTAMGVFFLEPSRVANPHGQPSIRSYMAYADLQGFIRYNLSDGTAWEPFRKYRGIETEVYDSISNLTGAAPREIKANSELAHRNEEKANIGPAVAPVITMFSPAFLSAGKDEVLTITGSGFGALQGTGFVEFTNSDAAGGFVKPLATDYVSWSDIEIKVHVPSEVIGGSGCAGTGVFKVTNSDPLTTTSATAVSVLYAHSNIADTGTGGGFPEASQMVDHVNKNGTGGYTLSYSSAAGDMDSNAAAKAAFERGLNTWTCATGMNWGMGASSPVDVVADDDVNIVRFGTLGPGTLGVATSRYSGCSLVAGYFTWEVEEVDITFSDTATWEFGPGDPIVGESDFESVALHEQGHCHQLKHTIEHDPVTGKGGVMHASLTSGVKIRTLSPSTDEAGGDFVMTKSLVANICGTILPMTSKAGVGCVATAEDSSISGQVTLPDGSPLAGVVMQLNGSDSRQTITDNSGFYSFGDVMTNGVFTLTPSRINYSFSPSQRSFALMGTRTDDVFTAVPNSVFSGSPIDTTGYFVRQHYLDFLNREPDEKGLKFWTGNILSCGDNAGCLEVQRINTSAAYFLSIEFQNTGYLVYLMYKAAYGDMPGAPVPVTFDEFIPDTRQIGRDVVVNRTGWQQTLENNKQVFADEFASRQRFARLYGALDDGEFVDALNRNAGGVLSRTERDGLVTDLRSRRKTRAHVLRSIAENGELGRREFNRAFVLMEYFGYMRRDPNKGPDSDFTGFDFWLRKLDQFNGNFEQAEMVKAFINSGEYRRRFGL